MKLEGIAIEVKMHPIGTVAEQRSDDGQGRRVDYRPATGGRSLSETGAEGSYRAELAGELPKGTRGEAHAKKVLLSALEAAGHKALELPKKPDDDRRGKDGLFQIDGKPCNVQLVTMPPDETLWKELADKGGAARVGSLSDAVGYMRASLEKKKDWWKGYLLVLDATNFGALSSRELVDAYLAAYGDPNVEFGFATTWIVGPTATSTFEIGVGSF
jgi:hypothetical protein